jgi:hypothetical protein
MDSAARAINGDTRATERSEKNGEGTKGKEGYTSDRSS